MKAAEYMEALKRGSEIVVVSNDPNTNSAIFYMDTRSGKLYTFSKFWGVMERTDLTAEGLVNHLKSMETESRIFVRGYED
jgi:hypothetical protein